MYPTDIPDIPESLIPLIIIVPLVFFLLMTASKIFLSFCIYNDAKYRQNDNAVLWGVLTFFFDIAALIYLIVQATSKDQPKLCKQCRGYLEPNALFCPRCGLPMNKLTEEQLQHHRKLRKLFLWLWIATIVISIIVGIILGVSITRIAISEALSAY